ncbi:unnamed protein product [Chilo suppressalis]|uniref:acylaminoacyl-peptidase n=1 Tax=Chilo suppressalis TaxID=168631 RepID=A0ABN8L594_CHISP|nr:unnamed protein product [Chilo suppressalis]
MNKMSQLESIVNAYKTLSKIPTVLGGKLIRNGSKISSRWSVRNLDKGKSSRFLYNYVLNDSFNVIAESEFGIDISNELLSSISPQETFKAVIREEKDSKDAKKQYLEVWKKNNLVHSIDLTALDIHGDVYADAEFGSLHWSRDESSIVYVAERKLPKFESYVKRKGEDKPKMNGSGEALPKKGEEYLYRQDWGEQLVGKYLSVIVVCKLQTETCMVLEGLPEAWCPGQVRFSADGQSVVGVAWDTEPRRLGLMFCTNRPSYIFNLTLDGHMRKISNDGMAVRSPRFSPNGDLFWLQRTVGGPHHACHQLVMLGNGKTKTTTVIDIVQDELKIAGGDSFYGVYCAALPERCFCADGKRLLLSTPQKNEIRSYIVDVDGGRIVDISNKEMPCSTTVLDIKSDVILAACSNLTTPAQLYVARLPSAGNESSIKWVAVSSLCPIPAAVQSSRVQYMHLAHPPHDADVNSFSAILMLPKVEGKAPLVVWPHGGPHSGFVNAFSMEAALFAMLGLASLQVNYRGSTGTGQASVSFLPKRVGEADVQDCKYATEEALNKFPLDEKRVALTGGSHGGFLVTHLSGQFPDLYKAVVTRNPVTDVASMFNSTDIADWCAVEAGFEFTEKGAVSEDQLLAMRRCSPLAHVHNVRAPTCLMLGSGDKRVPLFQGLEYARRLKANGVPTRIYMYDDNHSLSSLPAETDNLINGANWILDHLQS